MKTMVRSETSAVNRPVLLRLGEVTLEGELNVPEDAAGIVLFAHGSGSSRHSPRNQFVAEMIRAEGMGTLLFDLLTLEEEERDSRSGELRFDIDFLAQRLVEATQWLKKQPEGRELKVGYFGASTGGGAALVAAAKLGSMVSAVVSRGGRPDLAINDLPQVKSPTLLIVGGLDEMVLELNDYAYSKLRCEKSLRIVPGATHLFEEPGKLKQVAEISAKWFRSHFASSAEGRVVL